MIFSMPPLAFQPLRFSLMALGIVFCFASCGSNSSEPAASYDASDVLEAPLPAPAGRIIFFGDSLTEGYKLPREQAYPAIIERDLGAAGISRSVENAGVSGDTTADGRDRIHSELTGTIGVFMVALGANDAEDDLPFSVPEQNLNAIIGAVRSYAPEAKIIVAGLKHPRLMSTGQINDYQAMFARVATANGAVFLPDFLDGVAGHSELLLSDKIHPNAAGHQMIADTVWKTLLPLLTMQS